MMLLIDTGWDAIDPETDLSSWAAGNAAPSDMHIAMVDVNEAVGLGTYPDVETATSALLGTGPTMVLPYSGFAVNQVSSTIAGAGHPFWGRAAHSFSHDLGHLVTEFRRYSIASGDVQPTTVGGLAAARLGSAGATNQVLLVAIGAEGVSIESQFWALAIGDLPADTAVTMIYPGDEPGSFNQIFSAPIDEADANGWYIGAGPDAAYNDGPNAGDSFLGYVLRPIFLGGNPLAVDIQSAI